MLKTYIIHLERSTERLPLVKALKHALPSPQIVGAIDGRAILAEEVARITKRHVFGKKYPFDLLPGELGCFLSHREAWHQLVASGEDYALVVEDDAVLAPEFEQSFQLALENLTSESLIRFPIKQREVPGSAIAQRDGITLMRPKEIGLTTTMYLIGAGAAKRLLEASAVIDRPIDVWMQMRWETGVDSLTIWPSHVSAAPPSVTGSTIQRKRRGFIDGITRSVARSLYRAWVTRKSKAS